MYLDIFKTKSDKENLKSLQVTTAILSAVIVATIAFSEFTNILSRGLERAVVALLGFWILCLSMQSYLQKQSLALKIIAYAVFLTIYSFVILVYFSLKY